MKLGRRDVHLPKLMGVLLLVFGLLNVVKAVALMVDSWDALSNFSQCTPIDSAVCGEALFRITGVSIWAGQSELNPAQFWAALLGPIGNVFFWLFVLVIGLLLYKSGNFVFPFEEMEMRKRK